MPVVIPPTFGHVIQPITLATAGKSFSVTYGVNLDIFQAGYTDQEAVNDCQTAFVAAFRDFIDTSATIEKPDMYINNGGPGLKLVTGANAAVLGTRAVTGTPPNCAAVIRKRTDLVGKKFRGRMYMPCVLDETNVSETGVLTPTFIAALQAKADEFLQELNDADTMTGMWLLHSSAALAPNEVTSLPVQSIVRTQRRRLPKG